MLKSIANRERVRAHRAAMLEIAGCLLGGVTTLDFSTTGLRISISRTEYQNAPRPPELGDRCRVVLLAADGENMLRLSGEVTHLEQLKPDIHGPIDGLFIKLDSAFVEYDRFRCEVAFVGLFEVHEKVAEILGEESAVHYFPTPAALVQDIAKRPDDKAPTLIVADSMRELVDAIGRSSLDVESQVAAIRDVPEEFDRVRLRLVKMSEASSTLELLRAIDSGLFEAGKAEQQRNKYSGMAPFYDEAMLAGYYDYGASARDILQCMGEGAHTVLEAGVGTAIVAAEIKALNPDIHFIGVDHTEEMLAQAQTRLSGWGQLLCTDLTTMKLDQQVDAIFSHGGVWVFLTDYLLTHIFDPETDRRALRNVVGHLRLGGRMIINVQPMHTPGETQLADGREFLQLVTYIEEVHHLICEKDYVLRKDGDVLQFQRCSYRLTAWDRAVEALGSVGLEPDPQASSESHRVFRKVREA